MKCENKFQVNQHTRTPSHMAKVQKMKSSGTQITLKMSVENSVEKGGQAMFNDELCQAQKRSWTMCSLNRSYRNIATYLGVTLDTSLLYREHLEKMKQKTENSK